MNIAVNSQMDERKTIGLDLRSAVENGDVELARELLKPYDKNKSESNYTMYLFKTKVVMTNNYEMIKLFLECGYNNSNHYHYPAAFHDAVSNGNPEIVLLFLQYKANVHSLNHRNETALHIGCRKSCEEVVRLLVEAGSDIEWKDSNGYTPLHRACAAGKWDIVKFMISVGASVDTVDNDEYSPILTSLIFQIRNFEVFELLLKRSTNIQNDKDKILTQAISACQRDFDYSLDIIDILVKYFSLKTYLMDAYLFLQIISSKRSNPIFKKLIHFGWPFSVSGNLKGTALFHFATRDKFNLVHLFLATSRHYRKETWIKNEEELMKIKNEEIRQLIVSRTSDSIPSLKHLCRFAVRDSIGYPVTSKVATLALPKVLIDYLQLKSL